MGTLSAIFVLKYKLLSYLSRIVGYRLSGFIIYKDIIFNIHPAKVLPSDITDPTNPFCLGKTSQFKYNGIKIMKT